MQSQTKIGIRIPLIYIQLKYDNIKQRTTTKTFAVFYSDLRLVFTQHKVINNAQT